MTISIQANLTEDQAYILASIKWYSDTVSVITNSSVDPVEITTSQNTETPFEFLKRVYEQMIVEDAARWFIAYNDSIKQAEWEAEDQQIREAVISSISSSVE